MAWWRRWLGSDPVDVALARLAARYPGLAFAKRADDEVGFWPADGRRGAAIVPLRPAVARYEADGERGVDAWLDEPDVRRPFDVVAGLVDGPSPTRDTLFPRLVREDALGRLQGAARRPLFDDVFTTLVSHRRDTGAAWLTDDDVAGLGLTSFDDALAVAVGNLDAALKDTLSVQGISATPHGAPALLVVDHVHAAATLLVPEVRRILATNLGTPFLAMVPGADELVAAPTSPRARSDRHFATARRSYEGHAHPVSARVLLVDEGGFRPE